MPVSSSSYSGSSLDRAARSPRPGRRTGTRPAGSGSASAARRCWAAASRYHQYSLTSSPWLPSRFGQPEHPLLEDRVAARSTARGARRQPVEHVGDARHAVLVPAVGARAGVVVRERGPGVAAGAVVLADRAPGALRQVRAPLVPRARLVASPPRGGRRPPSACARRRRHARSSSTPASPGRAAGGQHDDRARPDAIASRRRPRGASA